MRSYAVAIRYQGERNPLLTTASFATESDALAWIKRVKLEAMPDDYVRDPSGGYLIGKAGRMESFSVVCV